MAYTERSGIRGTPIPKRVEIWWAIPTSDFSAIHTEKNEAGDLVITIKAGTPVFESCSGFPSTIGPKTIEMYREPAIVALKEKLDGFWKEKEGV